MGAWTKVSELWTVVEEAEVLNHEVGIGPYVGSFIWLT